MTKKNEYSEIKTSELITYANNSRTHTEAQIQQVSESIKEFGFTNPILVDEKNNIIAGHCRLMSAQRLNIDKVPIITLFGLTETQKKAYIIADNQLPLNAGWDMELLKIEVEDLQEHGFDLDLLGFETGFVHDLLSYQEDEDSPYSMNIEAPTYETSNVKPPLSDLNKFTKTDELLEAIENSKVTKAEKEFLRISAERHTVFDFGKIADYYAHSNKEMQSLMEQSALIIIDYNKALENGFVKIGKQLNEQYDEENPDEG